MKNIMKKISEAYDQFSRVTVAGQNTVAMANGLVLLSNAYEELRKKMEEEEKGSAELKKKEAETE